MLRRWNFNLQRKFQILPRLYPLFFFKQSVSVAKLSVEEPFVSHSDIDPVWEFLSDLRRSDFMRFLSRDDFRSVVSNLNQLQADQIIDRLSAGRPKFAVLFFQYMRNEFDFQHSRISCFVIFHILAKQKRLMELRFTLGHMLKAEGSGSAPSLCKLLLNDFKDWESNDLVWDMLAFVYSRIEMVDDALYVLATMKDLNLHASIFTYNSLLYNLRYTDLMWGAYNEIQQDGRTLWSKQTDSIIIDGLCGQSKLHDAVSFLRETMEKDLGPSVVSFNTIMLRYCKLGFPDIATSFLCMMLKCGLFPDSYSYNILTHGFSIAGSMEEALVFANDMEKHGIWPDLVTYNILVKGFRLLGFFGGARKVIQRMLMKGMNPGLVMYMILICGHFQSGNIEEGLNLQERILPCSDVFSVISHTILFSSLYKYGRIDEALKLLHKTKADGRKADLLTYSIVILSGLCEQGMLSEARMHFDSLAKSDVILYNIMIDGYVKHGHVAEGLEIYRLVIRDGVTPSVVTFNSLIHGFCKAGDLVKARELLEVIRLHGLELSAVTYTTLMNAYCEERNIQCMLELLREMNVEGIEPTCVTYTVLIKGLCRAKKLEEALQLLEHMYSRGVTPDQVTFNIVIQYLCEARDMTRAFRLLSYMLRFDLEPTPVTYNVLMNGLCVYGDLRDADKLLFELRKEKINLTKVAYTTVIKAHCAKGEVHRGIRLFSQMVEEGYAISLKDYSAVVNRLCKRGFVREAHSFLLSCGVSPDREICEVMISAYNQIGDLISSQGILVRMIKVGFTHVVES